MGLQLIVELGVILYSRTSHDFTKSHSKKPVCVGFSSYFGKRQEWHNESLASILTNNKTEHPDDTNFHLCYKKLYLPDFSRIIFKPHVFL